MAMEAARSDAVYDAVSSANLPIQYASISTSASADLVAAVAGKRIRVLDIVLVAAGAVTAQLQSNATTNLTGAMSLITGVPLGFSASQFGLFQTGVGEKLNLVLGGAVQISGFLVYVLV